MAYDEGYATLIREDLAQAGDVLGYEEKRMFGGLCFLNYGNMVCGVLKDGAMYRVGPERYGQALSLPGVAELSFTGRAMTGMVQVDDDALADDETRAELTQLAMAFAASLPPKPPKPSKSAKAAQLKRSKA